MSDYPERISISPVHRQKRDDDFYLVDRKAFPDKGVEYVRADLIEELEAKLVKAVEALEQIATHRKKCHEYDDDVGHERRTFDVEDMIIMEYAARTTLAELKGETDE